ncbi:unnamed protein product, partial [Callosobruchus maculatus]
MLVEPPSESLTFRFYPTNCPINIIISFSF